jgi:hypothetical protein
MNGLWLTTGGMAVNNGTPSQKNVGLALIVPMGNHSRIIIASVELYHTAEADIFEFQELVDAVMRYLTAEPGKLHASAWSFRGRNQAGIHAHHAVL